MRRKTKLGVVFLLVFMMAMQGVFVVYADTDIAVSAEGEQMTTEPQQPAADDAVTEDGAAQPGDTVNTDTVEVTDEPEPAEEQNTEQETVTEVPAVETTDAVEEPPIADTPADTKSKTMTLGGNKMTFKEDTWVSTRLPSLARPYQLKLTSRADKKILLEWTNCKSLGADIDGYIVLRRVGSETGYTEYVRTSATQNYYYDSNLQANTNYYYIVLGYKRGSDKVNTVSSDSMSVVGLRYDSTRKNIYGDNNKGLPAATLSETELQIRAGQTQQLSISYPAGAMSTWTRWRSDNSAIATVNSKGLVTAKSRGTVLISARTPSGWDVRCSVTVLPSVAGAFTYQAGRSPIEVIKGTDFTCSGIATSKNPIRALRVGVKSGNTWVDGASARGYSGGATYNSTSGLYTYQISQLNSLIAFDKLAAGSYTFNVYIEDTYGNGKYVLTKSFKVTTDADFEAWMTAQGFPESYKPALLTLHKAHPDWQFTAQKTGMTLDYAVKTEYNAKANYATSAENAYASESTIRYYMNPINFLNETDIFQFMDHNFYSSTASEETVKRLVNQNNCFLNTPSYISYLYNGGKNARNPNGGNARGVNPNVLTSMIIQEQGWTGGADLISGNYTQTIQGNGKVLSLKGYYNFFNIGAYYDTLWPGTAYETKVNATRRGLWYAAGSLTPDGVVTETGFSRPWNSIDKALLGGASWYKSNYVDNKQNTFYTKKFNVMNGTSNVAEHQYESYVAGAYAEGRILRQAYTSDYQDLVFRIPVYTDL